MSARGSDSAICDAREGAPASCRAGRDLAARLVAILSDLAAAASAEEIGDLVVGELCASLGARCAGLWSVEARAATLLRSAGRPEDTAALPRTIALDAAHPVAQAIAHGEVWGPFACVPLVVERRAVAALLARFDDARAPGDAERAFLRTLARQGAFALDRARLRASEQAAEARARRAAEAEAASAALFAQYRRIVEDAREGIWTVDADARTTFVNRRMAEMLGYAPDELLGRHSVDFVAPEARADAGALRERRRRGIAEAFDLPFRRRDGQTLWLRGNASAVFDASGAFAGSLALFSDITERRRAEQGRRVLARAGEVLASSLDDEKTLAAAAELAVPELADWCVVDLRDDGGTIVRVAVAHASPDHAALAAALRRHSVASAPRSVTYRVIESGEPALVTEVTPALIAEASASPEHRETLEALAVRSFMVVPLRSTDRVFGAITLLSAESGRRYDEGDLRVAVDLARYASTAIERAQLHRALARSAERMRSLVDLFGRIAEAGLNRGAILAGVARDVAEILGDLCVIRMVDEEGSSLPIAAFHHRDPEARAFAATLVEVPLRDGEGSTAFVYATRSPLRIAELSREEALRRVPPAHHPWVERYGVRSVMHVPLHVRGRVIGSISLTRDASGRPYGAEDEAWLVQVADRAALALANTELLATEQRLNENLAFLADASAIVASSRGVADTAERLARLVVPRLADSCVLDVVQPDGALATAAAVHVDPHKERLLREMRRRFPPDPRRGHPLFDVLRSGRPMRWERVTPASVEHFAENGEHLQMARQLLARSAILVPIAAHGRALGVLAVSAERPLGEDDLRTFEELGRRAASALEHGLVYEALHAERREAELAVSWISRLQEVTSALSTATTPRQVADVAVNLGLAAAGAQRGMVIVADEDDAHVLVLATAGSVTHGELPIRVPLTADIPPTVVFRTGVPIFVETAEEYRRLFPASHALSESFACIPLADAAGHTIGAVALGFDAPTHFAADQRDFLLTFARQAALALERARLYEAELRARREAESVSRAKDEFLTTLSHELRTPLTAIIGWSSILRARRTDLVAIDKGLTIIERNANAQARLVEDMLNVGRILAGKLRLERRAIDPADAVRAALDALRPAADAKGVRIEVRIEQGVGPILADAERLQQIAWNLLSNAVKFTPKGGAIELTLARAGERVELRVTDTGQGIGAEFLPHVFDRFRQADASLTRNHGGLGLGLSIAKHLVELHGGAISAASEGAGRGATFTVLLPIGAPREASLIEEPSPADAARLAGLRVLLVDDDRDTLETVAMVLREHGADVVEAGSAAEGLTALERSSVDVLVSDIGMPGEDGYALLQKARALVAKQQRELAALALTAYAGAQDASMAYRAGFQMHVSKPVSPVQIVDAVARLAETRERARA